MSLSKDMLDTIKHWESVVTIRLVEHQHKSGQFTKTPFQLTMFAFKRKEQS